MPELETAVQGAEVSADEENQEEASSGKRGGGFFRFLFIGLVIGAAIALFSRRGSGEDDEDFGEENWIEVKHEDSGTGAAVPTATPVSPAKPATEASSAGESEK